MLQDPFHIWNIYPNFWSVAINHEFIKSDSVKIEIRYTFVIQGPLTYKKFKSFISTLRNRTFLLEGNSLSLSLSLEEEILNNNYFLFFRRN